MARLAVRPAMQALPPENHTRFNESIRSRWMLRDAQETEIREFFEQIPLDDAMAQLAHARKMIETACGVINQRLSEETTKDKCTSCGQGSKRPDGQWVMQGSEKDKETGALIPYRYCSVTCVRDRNRKLMMPAGSPKHQVDGREFGSIDGV